MIETVYNNDNGETNETSRVQSALKMPKNIRQVGKSNAVKKIYVEDYVMTFIKQLAGEDFSHCKVAVLVGHYVKQENTRCLFINGALEVENLDVVNEILFTNDIWTSIYENIKKHFIDAEIVGWFIGGPGYQMEDMDRIRKAHVDNFAGQDKTLLIYDNMEKEEAFLLYENNRLIKQEGYYIYYEKNEDMQNYMIDHNKTDRVEEEYVDQVSKNIRTVIQNKQPVPEDNKSVTRLMYAAGTLLAVIILLVGAAMLNNYDQMKNMQKALDSLSTSIQQGDSSNVDLNSVIKPGNSTGIESVVDSSEGEDSDGQLDVNVIPGDLKPIDDKEKKSSGGEELAEDNEAQKKDDKDQNSSKNSAKEDSNTVSKKEVKYYTVVSGDSLAGISYKLYNTANKITTIKKLNNIEDEDMIYIGQKLIVP